MNRMDSGTGKAIGMRDRLSKKQRGRKTILMPFYCCCYISIYLPYEHNIVNVHLNVNFMQVQKRKFLC